MAGTAQGCYRVEAKESRPCKTMCIGAAAAGVETAKEGAGVVEVVVKAAARAKAVYVLEVEAMAMAAEVTIGVALVDKLARPSTKEAGHVSTSSLPARHNRSNQCREGTPCTLHPRHRRRNRRLISTSTFLRNLAAREAWEAALSTVCCHGRRARSHRRGKAPSFSSSTNRCWPEQGNGDDLQRAE